MSNEFLDLILCTFNTARAIESFSLICIFLYKKAKKILQTQFIYCFLTYWRSHRSSMFDSMFNVFINDQRLYRFLGNLTANIIGSYFTCVQMFSSITQNVRTLILVMSFLCAPTRAHIHILDVLMYFQYDVIKLKSRKCCFLIEETNFPQKKDQYFYFNIKII